MHDNSLFSSQYIVYLLFAFAYLCIALHIPPLIPFLIINNMSTLVINSSPTPVFLKQPCHANPDADKK